jgi:hypothetical protein
VEFDYCVQRLEAAAAHGTNGDERLNEAVSSLLGRYWRTRDLEGYGKLLDLIEETYFQILEDYRMDYLFACRADLLVLTGQRDAACEYLGTKYIEVCSQRTGNTMHAFDKYVEFFIRDFLLGQPDRMNVRKSLVQLVELVIETNLWTGRLCQVPPKCSFPSGTSSKRKIMGVYKQIFTALNGGVPPRGRIDGMVVVAGRHHTRLVAPKHRPRSVGRPMSLG